MSRTPKKGVTFQEKEPRERKSSFNSQSDPGGREEKDQHTHMPRLR